MRIRLALNSYTRSCGCLVGVYETYTGEVVEIIDAHGEHCPDRSHRHGARLATSGFPIAPSDQTPRPET
jgi:hypothetical protein